MIQNHVNQTVQHGSLFMDDLLQLDLSMIKLKLQDKDEGESWSQEYCNEVEIEYKRFLALKRKYPENEIVPNAAIDKFWHQHILDTAKYADDCQNYFGYFLHHYPYFGMNGSEDVQNLIEAFEETKKLYYHHFCEYYAGNDLQNKPPKCRTKCKPMKCK
jgi:hypothetical protein